MLIGRLGVLAVAEPGVVGVGDEISHQAATSLPLAAMGRVVRPSDVGEGELPCVIEVAAVLPRTDEGEAELHRRADWSFEAVHQRR
jgi:hypothetical protein